jgi:hypothetical protein
MTGLTINTDVLCHSDRIYLPEPILSPPLLNEPLLEACRCEA